MNKEKIIDYLGEKENSVEWFFRNLKCYFSTLHLVFKNKISFKYWLKHSRKLEIIVYTKQDFDIEHESYLGYCSGLKLIGKNTYELIIDKEVLNSFSGVKIYNPEHKGMYLKQENSLVKCEIQDGKLIPIQKEQITLDFPKTQYISLTNRAKEKNLTLKDYLLQQINSIL